jgi:hypothetical protein
MYQIKSNLSGQKKAVILFSGPAGNSSDRPTGHRQL